MTAEEFLDWAEHNPGSYEFRAGEVVAMSGGSREHEEVALRTAAAILAHLGRKAPCRVYASGLAVHVEANDRIHYPDVHVTCDVRDHADHRATRHPTLIVEVLSPSTRDFDQGDKFRSYKLLESLREYLLIDTSEQSVVLHRRVQGRRWETDEFGPGEAFRLESIDLTVAVDDLYDGVAVPLPRPRPQLVE